MVFDVTRLTAMHLFGFNNGMLESEIDVFCADVTTVCAHISAEFRLLFSVKENQKSNDIYRLRGQASRWIAGDKIQIYGP